MPRTRRAAAAAAAVSPPSPPRRLRRASHRSLKRAPRSLSRRRADFDRIAAHHRARPAAPAASLETPQEAVQSSVKYPPQEEDPPKDVGENKADEEANLFTADFVHAIPDEDSLPSVRLLVSRLRRLPDVTEEREPMEESPDSAQPSPLDKPTIRALANALAVERFLSHQCDPVRLLVACALAELLRVSAPDPPVSRAKLPNVCSLFVEQLAVLASSEDEMERDRFSLLEQLATTKSFVLFADEEEVVCDLFACFYAVVSDHQAAKVKEYFADVLFSLLDEMDNLGKEVLDALLAPFVESLRYSADAIKLAETVVTMAAYKIQTPLCQMLNASIRQLRQTESSATPQKSRHSRRRTPTKRARASKKEEDELEAQDDGISVHHKHIDDIIVAVNRVAPDILIYAIPSLHDQIQSADEECRLANVHLLARLLTSQRQMAESYPTLFAEFLSRNKDVNPAIREEVCSVLPKLMVTHARQREEIDLILRERVLDREESVRLVAIRSISEASGVASEKLLQILATRLRDRKAALRPETLKQLLHIYLASTCTSMTETLTERDSQIESNSSEEVEIDTSSTPAERPSEDENVQQTAEVGRSISKAPPAQTATMSWLPNNLLQSHSSLRGAEDFSTAFEIERVIFERIPGAKTEDTQILRTRLRRFADFLGTLHDGEFLHFINLVQERRRTRNVLLSLVNYRLSARKKPPTLAPNQEENQEEVKKMTFSKRKRTSSSNSDRDTSQPSLASSQTLELARSLSRNLRVSTKSEEEIHRLCLSVANAVDLRVFEKIGVALNECASLSERSAALQDAVSRLGSKSAAGCFLNDELMPRCMPGAFNSCHFAAACDIAVEEATKPREFKELEDPEQIEDHDDDCPVVLLGILRYLDAVRQYAPKLSLHNVDYVQRLVSMKLSEHDSSSDVIVMGLKLISQLPIGEESKENLKALSLEVIEPHILSSKLFNAQQGSNLSKWATRAIIRLSSTEEAGVKPIPDLMKKLTTRLDLFSGDVESVVAPLTALSQLAKHAPGEFKKAALECFDFARALLCGSFNGKVALNSSESGEDGAEPNRSTRRYSQTLSRRSSLPSVLGEDSYALRDQITNTRASCMGEVAHRCIKILVYALKMVDSNFEELDVVFEILLKIIHEKRGDIFGVLPNEESDSDNDISEAELDTMKLLCATTRLSAGRGMLYLARHPQFFRRLSPPLLVSTLLLAQDYNAGVRISFVQMISKQILKKGLAFRWVLALPLMAVDPKRNNVAKVKSLMTALFRHRRRIYEKARTEGKVSSIQLLPESVLPDMIWVLANLPDVELDRKASFAESEQCLDLLLDRLLESNEYATVLNEYIEGLSIAQDATETEDEGPGEKTARITELGRIAGVLLKKKQAGRTWNLSGHPGHVALPRDMFRVINRKAETSGVPAPSLVAVAKMYDEDNIRVSARKAKPSNLVARIKAAEKASKKSPSKMKSGRDEPDEEGDASEPMAVSEDGGEKKSEGSPMHSLDPIRAIENDSEPIEEKMGSSLKPTPNVEGRTRTRAGKRRSHESRENEDRIEADGKHNKSGKKRRLSAQDDPSPIQEQGPRRTSRRTRSKSGRGSGADERQLDKVEEEGNGLEPGSSIPDESEATSRSIRPTEGGTKDEEGGVKDVKSTEQGKKVKTNSEEVGKDSTVPEEESERETESTMEKKENMDTSNLESEGHGQSQRTLPRSKQVGKKSGVAKGSPTSKLKKKRVNKKAEHPGSAVPIVRRSSRRRRV